MIRNLFSPTSVVILATVALTAVSARPAAATFDVKESGKTITVTQLDTAHLLVIRDASGGLVVKDAVSTLSYPPQANLVVRGSTDVITPSKIEVVLHSALPGSLTLDLPGANDATVFGGEPRIEGSLTVKGSDAAGQIVRLGDVSHPFVVEGNVKLDMRGGNDKLLFARDGTILGSLTAKGVNELRANVLDVGGSLGVDVKRESDGVEIDGVTQQGMSAFVGKSLKVISGSGVDRIMLGGSGGAIGGSATFKLGDGVGDVQQIWTQSSTIGGNLVIEAGDSEYNDILFGSTIKGSVKIKSHAPSSYAYLYGRVEGPSIQYTGGDGRHSLIMRSAAPNTVATIKVGSGDDRLYLDGDSGLVLKRIKVDLGAGNNDFENYGFTVPPGSTFKGVS